MGHIQWNETILRQLSPVAWIGTMLTTYLLDVAFLLCRLCRFSSILQRHEVWRLRNQFRSHVIFFILNFPEIFYWDLPVLTPEFCRK